MPPDVELVSPKQAAQALGVSESSLKRWCDQGLIRFTRTAGGHRKIAVADVMRFVREHNHPLVAPEVLHLPPVREQAPQGLVRGWEQLVEALLAGDEPRARQIVIALYSAQHPLAAILDEVIAAAFHSIGTRWECREADVYQERRACEICTRILYDLRKLQPAANGAWLATGGTIEGDRYTLPSAMAELILRSAGFQAVSLGTSLPYASLVRAVRETRPKLFWLSVSHIAEEAEFLSGFESLSDACEEEGTALVVGGRALREDLRLRMSYSAHCDTMQHLARFAETLASTWRTDSKRRTAGSASVGKSPARRTGSKERKRD